MNLPPPPPLAPPAEAPLAQAGESVLVVEDDPAVRLLVLNVLDELGYTAHPAADANAALRLIESGEPATQVARDLGMSRATLYRRIRELPQARTI